MVYPPFYPNITFVKGNGAVLFDDQGRRFIDFSASAGMAIVGYSHPRMIAAITKQAEKLAVAPQKYRTEEADKLVEKLLALFPPALDTVVPCVTGSEAVETAMQIAMRHTGKKKFLSFASAYHGHTLLAGSLGAGEGGYGMLSNFFDKVDIPAGADQTALILKTIEEKFQTDSYAAFVGEGLVTNAGYRTIPRIFFQRLRELCDRYGVLLIFDEVLTGFGRTGTMFSFESHGIVPDIVCLAKGLASGYAAIAAVVTKRELVNGFDTFATFAWQPLACAIASENLDIIRDEELVENSRSVGSYALDELSNLSSVCKSVREVRGQGLGIAIEFIDTETAIRAYELCLEEGVILFRNVHLNMLFIQPPLIITKSEMQEAIKSIERAVVRL